MRDTVLILRMPDWMLRGQAKEDLRALTAVIGRELVVVGFDGYGHVELEFLAHNGFHTIFMDGESLRRTASAHNK